MLYIYNTVPSTSRGGKQVFMQLCSLLIQVQVCSCGGARCGESVSFFDRPRKRYMSIFINATALSEENNYMPYVEMSLVK